MKKIIIAAGICIMANCLAAQNIFRFHVLDSTTHEALAGVTAGITGTTLGGITDANGYGQIENIPNGNQTIIFTYVGYKKLTFVKSFINISDTSAIQIQMVEENTDLEEVVVSSTRSNSRVDDLPQKIEIIGEEDLM